MFCTKHRTTSFNRHPDLDIRISAPFFLLGSPPQASTTTPSMIYPFISKGRLMAPRPDSCFRFTYGKSGVIFSVSRLASFAHLHTHVLCLLTAKLRSLHHTEAHTRIRTCTNAHTHTITCMQIRTGTNVRNVRTIVHTHTPLD